MCQVYDKYITSTIKQTGGPLGTKIHTKGPNNKIYVSGCIFQQVYLQKG